MVGSLKTYKMSMPLSRVPVRTKGFTYYAISYAGIMLASYYAQNYASSLPQEQALPFYDPLQPYPINLIIIILTRPRMPMCCGARLLGT